MRKLTADSHFVPQLTSFGIGTNLVTCQKQPALGCVYKLVEYDGKPRIKLSQEFAKMTIPGRKRAYRLVGSSGKAIADYMRLEDDEDPVPASGERIVCRHPFDGSKRFIVVPSKVVPLHSQVFPPPSPDHAASLPLTETRSYVKSQLEDMFPKELTDYEATKSHDVMVSPKLYRRIQRVWESQATMEELR